MTEKPHSHHLRLHRDTATPGTWFITKCLQPRRPVLLDTDAAKVIIAALAFCVQKSVITLGAFVVMDDHWHALLATSALASAMHSIDSWVGSKTFVALHHHKTTWQDSYHDTRILSTHQLVYVRHYIEGNPVRKGCCIAAKEWPWSSAHKDYQHLVVQSWPWGFPGDHI